MQFTRGLSDAEKKCMFHAHSMNLQDKERVTIRNLTKSQVPNTNSPSDVGTDGLRIVQNWYSFVRVNMGDADVSHAVALRERIETRDLNTAPTTKRFVQWSLLDL